jgi:hypothetical protein
MEMPAFVVRSQITLHGRVVAVAMGRSVWHIQIMATPLEMLMALYQAGQQQKAAARKQDVEPRMTRQPLDKFPQFKGIKKTCPKCKQEKDGLEGFGVRLIRGRPGLQSHCRACRSAQSKNAPVRSG